jgi:hypothetical protein
VLEGSGAADQAEGVWDIRMLLDCLARQMGGGAVTNFEFCQGLMRLALQVTRPVFDSLTLLGTMHDTLDLSVRILSDPILSLRASSDPVKHCTLLPWMKCSVLDPNSRCIQSIPIPVLAAVHQCAH